MPTFFNNWGGIDHKAQYEHEQKQRAAANDKEMIKAEIIRQTEIATGKIHALVDGEDRYFTPQQYKLLGLEGDIS